MLPLDPDSNLSSLLQPCVREAYRNVVDMLAPELEHLPPIEAAFLRNVIAARLSAARQQGVIEAVGLPAIVDRVERSVRAYLDITRNTPGTARMVDGRGAGPRSP